MNGYLILTRGNVRKNILHKAQTRLGAESQAAVETDNEVFHVGVGFRPHVDCSFLVKRFLSGEHQSPHQGMSPQFWILSTVVEYGKEVVAENILVGGQKRLKTSHGGVTNSAILVLIKSNGQQDLGSDREMDISQSKDGFGLFLESGGSVELITPQLHVLVEKARLDTTVLLASSAKESGEGKFNDAVAMGGHSGLGEEWLKFLEEVFGGVAHVIGERRDNSEDDQGFLGFLNDITDDEGGWAGSGDDKGVQEKLAVRRDKIVINLVAQDKWKK